MTLLGPNQVLTGQLVVAGLTRDFGDGRHGISLPIEIADQEMRIGTLIRQPVPPIAVLAEYIAYQVGRDWENFRLVPIREIDGLGD